MNCKPHKILVKCKDCDSEWMKDKATVNNGKWSGRCIKCAAINRNKNKEFTNAISIANKGKRCGSENHMWKPKKKCIDCDKEINHTSSGAIRCDRCSRKNMSGANNNRWKGGITPENTRIRGSAEYKEWAKAVKVRDNYTCQICKKRGCTLHSDHIKPFSLFPELRLDIDNGRTLCEDCHIKFGWNLFKNKNPRKKEYRKDEFGKRIISEKTRERFREIGREREISQKTKDKISENLKIYYKNNFNKRKQTIICMNNHNIYFSNLEAAKDLNLCDAKIGAVLNGNRNHTNGYKFQRVTEEHLIF